LPVGIVTVKRGWRRGAHTEEWSNKYHLSGPDPGTPTAWKTLFDALVAEEKKLVTSGTSVVRGYGYDSDSDDATAVWGVDMTVSPNVPVPGTYSTGLGMYAPSDAAAWVRWKLDRNNSKGKAIFLRKYFHDVCLTTPTPSDIDAIETAQKTAYAAFSSLLFTGAGIDGGRHIRDTGGGNVIASGYSNYVTTRTLKRRGKRP
jgi:hypothetical protein